MSFHNERVGELKNLYLATFPEEEREGQQWDLSINSLKEVGGAYVPVGQPYFTGGWIVHLLIRML